MSMPRWFIYSNRRNPGSALLHLSGKFGPRAPLGIRGNKSLGQGARKNRRRGNKWKIPLRLCCGGEDYDGELGRDGAGGIQCVRHIRGGCAPAPPVLAWARRAVV